MTILLAFTGTRAISINILLVTALVTFIMEYTQRIVEDERKKEWKGLLKAFSMIDKESMLNWTVFIILTI